MTGPAGCSTAPPYSKTIAPGLRVGWIAPGRHFNDIVTLKALMNIGVSSAYQIAMARFLKEGGFGRHVRNLRKNILIAPGALFSLKDKFSHCMHLNAGAWNPEIEQAVAYVGRLCCDQLTRKR